MARFTTSTEVADFLRANPEASAFYGQRDATGSWNDAHAVWLDSYGDLVQAHPTDSRRGPIPAPEQALFHVDH